MKVTSVNVKKIEKENSRMKGIASILLDDMIMVYLLQCLVEKQQQEDIEI